MRVSVVATGIGAVPAGAYSNQQRPAVAAQASDAIGIARPVTSNNMFSTFSGFNSSATQTPTTTFAETIRDTTIPSDQHTQDNQESENIHQMSTEEEFIELSDEPATEGFDHVEPIQAIEQPAEKKKGPSLFERFTGVSRKTSQSAPVIETNFQQQSNQKKDDLIDIPAFLRRGG
jgi:hypothetical protein